MRLKLATAMVVLLMVVASSALCGCTSLNNSNQGATNAPNTSTTTTANATKNVAAAVKTNPTATTTTPTPIVILKTPTATAQKYNYHVLIVTKCCQGGCSNCISEYYGYQQHYAGNSRVSEVLTYSACGMVFHRNCSASDIMTTVKVIETGQTADFPVWYYDPHIVEQWIDAVLAQ